MPPPAAPEVPLDFTPEQDKVVTDLAHWIHCAALASLSLAGLSILTGLVIWFWLGSSFWGGLFAILVGAITKFLGLVLLSTAADMRYIASTQGYDKIHLLNGLTSINVWLKTTILLASIVGVVAFFRLLA